jgi:hypothetical protein
MFWSFDIRIWRKVAPHGLKTLHFVSDLSIREILLF